MGAGAAAGGTPGAEAQLPSESPPARTLGANGRWRTGAADAANAGVSECNRCHHGTCAGLVSARPVWSDEETDAEADGACMREGGSWKRRSGDIGSRFIDGVRAGVADEGVCSREEELEAGLRGGDCCMLDWLLRNTNPRSTCEGEGTGGSSICAVAAAAAAIAGELLMRSSLTDRRRRREEGGV